MLRRLLLILSLVFLFGLSQQGAAVHAISHLADGQQSESQQDKKAHHLSFCDKCVAYAALDSVAGTNQIAFGSLDGHQVLFIASETQRLSTNTPYYAARAPPTLV
jgi:hypothetical protein